MRRVLLVSLSLASFVWITGCGSIYGSGSGGGGNTPNALSGQYAILLAGFDSTGNPMGIAGSIKADGLGHITGGEVDVNDNGVISSNSALAGSYAFDATGQSTLGTITLTNTVGTVAHPLAFGFSLQTSGAFGQIMSLDTNNFIAAGTMQLQSSSVFTLANLGDLLLLDGGMDVRPRGRLLGPGGGTMSRRAPRALVLVRDWASATFGPRATNGRGLLTHDVCQPQICYYAHRERMLRLDEQHDATLAAPLRPASFAGASSDGGVRSDTNTLWGVQPGRTAWDTWDSTMPVLPGTPFWPAVLCQHGRDVAVPAASGACRSVAFFDRSGRFLGDDGAWPWLGLAPRRPYSAATDLGGLGIVRTRGLAANDAIAL